ncbi:uncharacterized protein LOC144490794, partial [Mustelus asterias]
MDHSPERQSATGEQTRAEQSPGVPADQCSGRPVTMAAPAEQTMPVLPVPTTPAADQPRLSPAERPPPSPHREPAADAGPRQAPAAPAGRTPAPEPGPTPAERAVSREPSLEGPPRASRLPAPPASPRISGGGVPPDALSLADTVSLSGQMDSVSMYGTAESLLQEDGSSLGSDSELNGSTASSRRTDKYGFLGGAQFCGAQDSAIPLDVARQRELKWLEMLSHWDKWVARRFDK